MSRKVITRDDWKKIDVLEKLFEGYTSKMKKVVLIKSLNETIHGFVEDTPCEFNELHRKGRELTLEELREEFDMPSILYEKYEISNW